MLPRIKARRELQAMRTATAPHLGKDDRKRYRDSLERAARLHKQKPVRATAADLAALGIQREEVTM